MRGQRSLGPADRYRDIHKLGARPLRFRIAIASTQVSANIIAATAIDQGGRGSRPGVTPEMQVARLIERADAYNAGVLNGILIWMAKCTINPRRGQI